MGPGALYWGWILKSIINICIEEIIPFIFGELIEDVSIGGGGSLDKISVVSFLEDEN